MNGEPNRIIQEKGGRTMLIGLILTSVVLAGFAQITLKTGVNHVTATSGGELHLSAGSLRSLLSSPIVWGGLVLFGLSAIVWLFALIYTLTQLGLLGLSMWFLVAMLRTFRRRGYITRYT